MSDTTLAARAVACKGWRWLGGEMQLIREHGTWRRYRRVCPTPSVGTLPDLDDHATLGCLLALVREAWSLGISQRRVFVKPDADGWVVRVHTTVMGGVPVERPLIPFSEPRGATEAEALIAALEAAP